MRAARQASSMRQEGRETHDIVENITGHQLGMLEHHADLATDLAWVEGGQLAAVIGDRARRREPRSPESSRIRVDFPEPEGPTIATNSPGRT